jgi:hypothetical protein
MYMYKHRGMNQLNRFAITCPFRHDFMNEVYNLNRFALSITRLMPTRDHLWQ